MSECVGELGEHWSTGRENHGLQVHTYTLYLYFFVIVFVLIFRWGEPHSLEVSCVLHVFVIVFVFLFALEFQFKNTITNNYVYLKNQ